MPTGLLVTFIIGRTAINLAGRYAGADLTIPRAELMKEVCSILLLVILQLLEIRGIAFTLIMVLVLNIID